MYLNAFECIHIFIQAVVKAPCAKLKMWALLFARDNVLYCTAQCLPSEN